MWTVVGHGGQQQRLPTRRGYHEQPRASAREARSRAVEVAGTGSDPSQGLLDHAHIVTAATAQLFTVGRVLFGTRLQLEAVGVRGGFDGAV